MKKTLALIVSILAVSAMGQKWEMIKVQEGIKCSALYFESENIGYIVGNSSNSSKIGKVLKTGDGGKTWQEVLNIDGEEELDGIYFGKDDKVFLTGKNAFYITDKGFTATEKHVIDIDTGNYLADNTHISTLMQFTTKRLGAFGSSNYLSSRTGGQFWISRAEGSYDGSMLRILCSITLNKDTAIALGAGMIIKKTFDKGETWENMMYNAPENEYYQQDFRELFSVTTKPDGSFWAVGGGEVIVDWNTDERYNKATIIKLNGVEQDWNPVSTKGIDDKEVLAYIKFFSNTTGIVVAESGVVYKTTDGGNSWIKMLEPTDQHSIIKACFVSPACGYIISKRALHKYMEE